VILSDRTIREELADGGIVIDPLDASLIQPASVDLRLDRLFRVFRNYTTAVIDLKEDLEDLTELVTIPDDGVFLLHPGEFVLGSTLERVGLGSHLVGRVEGKALSVATPIPTTIGRRTMGDLLVGHEVFTDTGAPTRVRDATEVMFGRPCREVVFSDGSVIVADADHLWETVTKSERKRGLRRPALRTTEQIASSLRVGREWNHHVNLAGMAQHPERDLPIDPYVLGVWLGDGTSTSARITTADEEVLDHIRALGYSVAKASGPLAWLIGGAGHTRNVTTGRYARNASLSSRLRDLGLLGNKQVPPRYLEASPAQRLALLQGLMDSDGTCDVIGRAEFTSTKEALAEAVVDLVASLGMRPAIRKDRATLRGVDLGPRYRVVWVPDRPVFRLTRKLARLRPHGPTQQARAIVAVREIPSVPVRCIEVEATTGMYVAGRTYIPTHNSSLGRLGLLIHSTAGFVDPGFDGHVTLELSNVATLPITLYPGMRIGQVSFLRMTTPADVPYGSGALGSKYQGQRGPTPSRYHENFRPPPG
jgi:deoxycytidine triphosphate deaminase